MSFLEKIKSKVETVSDQSLTLAGIKVASAEVKKQRIEICNTCEHLFRLTRTCKKCGCFVEAKTKIESQHCPINKW